MTPPAQTTDPASDRYKKGLEVLDSISVESGRAMVDNMRRIAPALADWAVEFGDGDVLSRPGPGLRTRQLATVAATPFPHP